MKEKRAMWTQPCAEWAEKLAALHPDDLTSNEQEKLNVHLTSCNGCAQSYRDYRHLASLVQDLSVSESMYNLPGLPELPAEREAVSLQAVQPGITSSMPEQMRPIRRRWSVSGVVLAAGIVLLLVADALLGNVLSQRIGPSVVSQGQGPVYTITPQGGPPPPSTPEIDLMPLVLPSLTPPFFLNGSVYKDATAYNADTGALVQHYLKKLGAVQVHESRLVNGVLYMTVELMGQSNKMAMYALRTSDGAVLWKFDTCGNDIKMSPPTIADDTVYFICQAAPGLYWLYAVHAKTGVPLWRNTLSNEGANSVQVYRHKLYVTSVNQLLVENAQTGALLWEKSFGESNPYIDQLLLSNGILYINQGRTIFAENADEGAIMWKYQFIGGYSAIGAFVDQNELYLYATERGSLSSIYAIDGTTGRQFWQKQLDVDTGLKSFVVDHGKLFMCVNVYATPSRWYAAPLKRELLAIQGSDGRTLWRQDIPWNRGKLLNSLIVPPMLSAGDGRVYLVDWASSQSAFNGSAIMGAFSESNGALLWTTDVTS